MLTDEVIERAIRECKDTGEKHHEHNDCIRIAYEWLDAQTTIKTKPTKTAALKHLVEDWGGRYISTDDVIVAAYLHPKIEGKYPTFNLSTRFCEPSLQRLEGIGQAFMHKRKRNNHDSNHYAQQES